MIDDGRLVSRIKPGTSYRQVLEESLVAMMARRPVPMAPEAIHEALKSYLATGNLSGWRQVLKALRNNELKLVQTSDGLLIRSDRDDGDDG